MEQFKTTTFIKRLIPAVTVWAVGKVLESPRVKQKLDHVDRNIARNVKRNRGWLAAGAAAMLIGAGLMAKSTRP